MKSQILLINFDKKDASKLNKLSLHSLQVDRGYISDVIGYSEHHGTEKREELVNYFLPHPVYEYKVAIVNLNYSKAINEEFKRKAKDMTRDRRREFYEFWNDKGVFIIFLGNYGYSDLINLGIPGIGLETVDVRDITCNFALDDKTNLRKALKESRQHVVMPTKKYIIINKKFYGEDTNSNIRKIYVNLGNEVLGCYLNGLPSYDDEDAPLYILLPQFENNILVIGGLLRELAKIYPKLLPEIYEPDWIDSEKYYPKEVSVYNEEKKKIAEKAEEEISKLSMKKEKAKKKYAFLRGILVNSGDELKQNVIQVLRNIFRVKVTDVDRKKRKNLAEDVLINYNGRKILAEIKGTNSQNASPVYIAQVWKHIHHSGCRDIADGCLILNYDIKSDPKERPLAYTGEYEKELEDIIFIDTRVVFYLAIAIIDYDLSVENAKPILFQKGRATFDLESYLKRKSSQK